MTIEKLVDQLGYLRAQIADLEAVEKRLKDQIASRGAGAYEGEVFRARVTVGERETLDMVAVREKLTPQFIKAHTKVSETVTVRVGAKVDGQKAVAA